MAFYTSNDNVTESVEQEDITVSPKTYTQADMDAYRVIVEKERAISKQLKTGRAAELEELSQLRSAKEQREQKEAESRGDYEKSLSIQVERAAKAEAKAAAAIAKANKAIVSADLSRHFSGQRGMSAQSENFSTLAMMGIVISEDGSTSFPAEALKANGEPVSGVGDYVEYLRDSGKLSFAFEAQPKAAGTNAISAKQPPAPSTGVLTVPMSEAYKHTAGIRAGTVKISS